MDFIKKNIVGVVALIIALIGVFTPIGTAVVNSLGTATTNYTSIGTTALNVGTGCGDSNTTCTGTSIDTNGNLTEGGLLSTSTPASMTLAPSDLDHSSMEVLLSVGAATMTLPATTTAGMSSFLPHSGDTTLLVVTNATTSAFSLTLAGGTGTTLETASTSVKLILPGGSAQLRAVRRNNGDIIFQFVPFI